MTSLMSTPPKDLNELSKAQARSPTPSEMDEMSGRILLDGLRELREEKAKQPQAPQPPPK